MEDKSKKIYGNDIDRRAYRKAVNSKKRFAKKYGDDSRKNYPVTVNKNKYIGDALGVYDVRVGDKSEVKETEKFDTKSGSFAMAITGYIVLLILVFTSMSSVFVLFIPAFFIFAANGMLLVLTTIFLANTVDYGELKNNRRDESVIFSMQTFVVKLASGVAALVVSICLSLSHLSSNTDADAAVTTGGSVAGLRMTMTVIPIIGLIIALIYFHKKYILTDKKMEEITKGIKERRN